MPDPGGGAEGAGGDAQSSQALQDGDVIYVARNNVAKLGYVLQKVSPLTGWMLFTTAFGSK